MWADALSVQGRRSTVAVALAQIGEFSFILSTLGRELGLLHDRGDQHLVAASIVSIVAQPAALSRDRSDRRVGGAAAAACARWLDRIAADRQRRGAARCAAREPRAHRAVVIGYGPTGRTVARLLKENGIEPTVVELNIDTVRELRQAGRRRGLRRRDAAGDARARPASQRAGNLILTSAGMANSTEVIRAAREVNPGDPRAGARRLPARSAEPESAPAPTPCSPAKAKWRWPSSRTCSCGSARPPSRSIASAPAPTTSCSATALVPDRRGASTLRSTSPARSRSFRG